MEAVNMKTPGSGHWTKNSHKYHLCVDSKETVIGHCQKDCLFAYLDAFTMDGRIIGKLYRRSTRCKYHEEPSAKG